MRLYKRGRVRAIVVVTGYQAEATPLTRWKGPKLGTTACGALKSALQALKYNVHLTHIRHPRLLSPPIGYMERASGTAMRWVYAFETSSSLVRSPASPVAFHFSSEGKALLDRRCLISTRKLNIVLATLIPLLVYALSTTAAYWSFLTDYRRVSSTRID